MSRRVVLIGASGVFGARMAARLALWPGIELVLAGRRAEPLVALQAELAAAGAAAELSVATLDRQRPSEVAALSPWAVVDAAGPFQGASYDLARSVIEAGAHWVDLADARDFVAGFAGALDDLAQRRGVVAVTGASSSPALTDAALTTMTGNWRRTWRIRAAIAPGAQPPGLSVVRACLSWAGQPLACFAGGEWTERPGWSGLEALRFPGVGRRRVSLADTPDLDLLARRVSEEGLIFAGIEPPLLHVLLWLIAWPVRLRLAPGLARLARPLRALAAPLTRFGAPRGGMVVLAEGEDAHGERRVARWSLATGPGAGPSVPGAPALAALRAIGEGRLAPGARPCVGQLRLDDILAELTHLPITTALEAWSPERQGLFPRVLGDAFEALPDAVRAAHGGGALTLRGRAASRGAGGPAALGRRIAGLPGPGRYDVEVSIRPAQGGEVWTRRFGARRFSTRLVALKAEPGLFEERLGPMAFRFSAACDAAGFDWIQERWSFAGVPMPRWLGPRVRARTFARDGAYRFRVVLAHPWLGVIAAYAGRLNVNAP
jgi:hypothetical protein